MVRCQYNVCGNSEDASLPDDMTLERGVEAGARGLGIEEFQLCPAPLGRGMLIDELGPMFDPVAGGQELGTKVQLLVAIDNRLVKANRGECRPREEVAVRMDRADRLAPLGRCRAEVAEERRSGRRTAQHFALDQVSGKDCGRCSPGDYCPSDAHEVRRDDRVIVQQGDVVGGACLDRRIPVRAKATARTGHVRHEPKLFANATSRLRVFAVVGDDDFIRQCIASRDRRETSPKKCRSIARANAERDGSRPRGRRRGPGFVDFRAHLAAKLLAVPTAVNPAAFSTKPGSIDLVDREQPGGVC
jgi:hypothetical protein